MDKLKMQTENIVDENVEKIGKLFPNAVVEAKDENGKTTKMVDFDVLKQELSNVVVDGDKERYVMTWPDKKQAILTANAPISKTLRPCKAESVGKDGTAGGFDSENIYIEGDNLDVLKVLRETYLGKIKMIYIDPPYNTGNDFVYNDDFATSTEDYLERSNQVDEEGNRMIANNESNGRFHTDWLNMIYPRLKLAKDLLTDDGAIFISIDDNEQANLKKICDEIFGENNFICNFIWKSKSGGANDSKFVAVDHEYVLFYCKNSYSFSTNLVSYNDALLTLYTGKDEYYEKRGPYRPMLLQQKGLSFSKSLTYEIDAPDGSKLVPESGGAIWRWSKDKFLKAKADGYIEFKKVGNEYKVYTKQYLNVDYEGKAIERGKLQRSVIDDVDGRLGTRNLQTFFTSKLFTNSKPKELIYKFLKICSNYDDKVLDFFSGSATTAHAVMQLNAEDGGNRKFIMVQLPEVCDEKSEAYKAGYKNICEIGKERIRRAGKNIAEKTFDSIFTDALENSKPHKSVEQVESVMKNAIKSFPKIDIGFRVFKLDSSNMKDRYYKPNEYSESLLDAMEENIKTDRTAEDLLFQVMLDLGLMLDSKIEEKTINGKKVFVVGEYNEMVSPDLICCFDSNVDDKTVTDIAKLKPRYAVFRDSSLGSDSVAVNFDQIFQTYSPSTTRKVL